MAPASASPQPPAERSDIAQSEERGQRQQADEHEVYGLLDIERRVKDDGRGLILYTRREHEAR